MAAGLTYTYRIKAINEHGVSRRSRWFHVDTPAAPEAEQAAEPPARPRGLSATATHDQVVLTWDDPGDASIIGYAVVRWTLGYNATGFVTIAADTGTAATSYTDDTVEPKNEYLYHVKAIDAQGESEQSEWVRVTTPADPNPAPAEPPARPTGVVSAAASDLVLLSWADPGDDSVTGYRILRRGIADEADDFVTLAEDTGTAETSYADDTVENGRVYVYRVLAIGPGGLSEPSRDVGSAPLLPWRRRTGLAACPARAPLTPARASPRAAQTFLKTARPPAVWKWATRSWATSTRIVTVTLSQSSWFRAVSTVSTWRGLKPDREHW